MLRKTIATRPDPIARLTHGVMPVGRRLTAVGMAVVCSAVFASNGASASTGWAIQPTPNPQFNNGSLASGKCSGTSVCTAVGNYNNSSGTQVTLAERWNGADWAIQSTPNPTGATRSALSGVACTAATACTAIGDYFKSGIGLTLAERWNGTSWAISSTPNPAGATFSFLSGVDCTAASTCIAVGTY